MPFFTMNISDSLLRFGIDKEYKNDKVFTTGIYIFVSLSIILLPLTYSLCNKIYVELNPLIIVLIMLSSYIYPILHQFTRSIDKLKLFAISDILYTFLFSLLNILLVVKYNLGIKGYFISFILAKAIASIYLIIGAKLYKYF